MSGTVYIIGTPIGNLEDITYRQIRLLWEVDFICAEDTRVTARLLNYYDIKKRLVSFHEHSSRSDADRIISAVLDGADIGIVTDAGMPCISDPGQVLVKLAHENNIPVRVVPGATAVTSALALSGLKFERFTFEGFLPVDRSARNKRLEILRDETAVMVFYEAPHNKLKNTLNDFAEIFGGDRNIVICRELTKIYEETLRFTVSQAVEYFSLHEPRGEFVLIVEGGKRENLSLDLDSALEQVLKLVEMGEKPTDACKAVAKETGIKKGELYSALQKRGTDCD